MKQFRLPRKIKKSLKGNLWLYPADEKGNSLIAHPTNSQEDYLAIKQGIVKNLLEPVRLKWKCRGVIIIGRTNGLSLLAYSPQTYFARLPARQGLKQTTPSLPAWQAGILDAFFVILGITDLKPPHLGLWRHRPIWLLVCEPQTME